MIKIEINNGRWILEKNSNKRSNGDDSISKFKRRKFYFISSNYFCRSYRNMEIFYLKVELESLGWKVIFVTFYFLTQRMLTSICGRLEECSYVVSPLFTTALKFTKLFFTYKEAWVLLAICKLMIGFFELYLSDTLQSASMWPYLRHLWHIKPIFIDSNFFSLSAFFLVGDYNCEIHPLTAPRFVTILGWLVTFTTILF